MFHVEHTRTASGMPPNRCCRHDRYTGSRPLSTEWMVGILAYRLHARDGPTTTDRHLAMDKATNNGRYTWARPMFGICGLGLSGSTRASPGARIGSRQNRASPVFHVEQPRSVQGVRLWSAMLGLNIPLPARWVEGGFAKMIWRCPIPCGGLVGGQAHGAEPAVKP